jgi:ribosomal protein L13
VRPAHDPDAHDAPFLKSELTHIVDAGDYVVVSDALSVRLTGRKAIGKVYKHHTGFIGGLKEVPITTMRVRRPEEVSREARSRSGHVR